MLNEKIYIDKLIKICDYPDKNELEPEIHRNADELLLEIIEKELGYNNLSTIWKDKRDTIRFWYE